MTILESASKQGTGIGEPALPIPVPALVDLHRAREPGSETRAYVSLDRNERLQPFPDWFLETLRQSLQSTVLTSYPITDGIYLQLSTQLGISEEQLLLTAGSDAAIKAVYHAYVRPGDLVMMLDPSYTMYRVYGQMFQAEVVPIPFDRSLALDTNLLLGSIVPRVRLVMLANPNQPTATLLEEDVLLQLVDRTREVGALLAIDEAYYSFSHTTMLPWIKQAPHLLVIRSLSKAAGLAGLRIGFVAGHRDVVANLYKVRSAHNVNSMAILCASQILNHPEIIDDYVIQVEAGGQLLAERLRALGLVPLPTHTNFMLIRVGHRCPPAELVAELRNNGYLVKGPFRTSCLADCIRVTLGPPSLMAAFADVLERVLGVAK